MTLSERHQMFQAFLSAGSVTPPALQIKDSSPFYSEFHSERCVKDTIFNFGFTQRNTTTSVDVQHNGIIYKRGQFVVTKNDVSMEFGEIILVLVKNDFALYLLIEYMATNSFHTCTLSKMTV